MCESAFLRLITMIKMTTRYLIRSESIKRMLKT